MFLMFLRNDDYFFSFSSTHTSIFQPEKNFNTTGFRESERGFLSMSSNGWPLSFCAIKPLHKEVPNHLQLRFLIRTFFVDLFIKSVLKSFQWNSSIELFFRGSSFEIALNLGGSNWLTVISVHSFRRYYLLIFTRPSMNQTDPTWIQVISSKSACFLDFFPWSIRPRSRFKVLSVLILGQYQNCPN